MAEDAGSTEPPIETELAALARDWMTLWQSELAALAADREAQEAWQKLISFWTGAANLFAAAGLDGSGTAGRDATAAAAPRPPPAAAAPDPRDAEIERLRGRVDALEQRLADLERQPPTGGVARRRARRGSGGEPPPP